MCAPLSTFVQEQSIDYRNTVSFKPALFFTLPWLERYPFRKSFGHFVEVRLVRTSAQTEINFQMFQGELLQRVLCPSPLQIEPFIPSPSYEFSHNPFTLFLRYNYKYNAPTKISAIQKTPLLLAKSILG